MLIGSIFESRFPNFIEAAGPAPVQLIALGFKPPSGVLTHRVKQTIVFFTDAGPPSKPHSTVLKKVLLIFILQRVSYLLEVILHTTKRG